VSELRRLDWYGVRGLVFLCRETKGYSGVVTIHGLSNQPAAFFKLLHLERAFQS
jgi:hypothetical protein